MEKSIRTRAIFIALVIVACVIGIIGLPKNFEVLKENVRNRIRLGLDLRGGTHLVLQVHVEDAVNVTSDQAMERVRDELRAKNIPYVDVQKTDSTHVVVRGIPQAKAGDVRTLVSDQFSDWDVVA